MRARSRRIASSTPIAIQGSVHWVPNLCAPSPDVNAAVEALCHYSDLDVPIADALLDQQVACGVGNVFRSEILWACQHHPLAPVSMLARTDMERIIMAAVQVLHANVHPGDAVVSDQRAGLAVYGRNGQRCQRCGDTIEVRRLGEQARLLYWCPGCQVRRGPRAAPAEVDQRPDGPASRRGKVPLRAPLASPRPCWLSLGRLSRLSELSGFRSGGCR